MKSWNEFSNQYPVLFISGDPGNNSLKVQYKIGNGTSTELGNSALVTTPYKSTLLLYCVYNPFQVIDEDDVMVEDKSYRNYKVLSDVDIEFNFGQKVYSDKPNTMIIPMFKRQFYLPEFTNSLLRRKSVASQVISSTNRETLETIHYFKLDDEFVVPRSVLLDRLYIKILLAVLQELKETETFDASKTPINVKFISSVPLGISGQLLNNASYVETAINDAPERGEPWLYYTQFRYVLEPIPFINKLWNMRIEDKKQGFGGSADAGSFTTTNVFTVSDPESKRGSFVGVSSYPRGGGFFNEEIAHKLCEYEEINEGMFFTDNSSSLWNLVQLDNLKKQVLQRKLQNVTVPKVFFRDTDKEEMVEFDMKTFSNVVHEEYPAFILPDKHKKSLVNRLKKNGILPGCNVVNPREATFITGGGSFNHKPENEELDGTRIYQQKLLDQEEYQKDDRFIHTGKNIGFISQQNLRFISSPDDYPVTNYKVYTNLVFCSHYGSNPNDRVLGLEEYDIGNESTFKLLAYPIRENGKFYYVFEVYTLIELQSKTTSQLEDVFSRAKRRMLTCNKLHEFQIDGYKDLENDDKDYLWENKKITGSLCFDKAGLKKFGFYFLPVARVKLDAGFQEIKQLEVAVKLEFTETFCFRLHILNYGPPQLIYLPIITNRRSKNLKEYKFWGDPKKKDYRFESKCFTTIERTKVLTNEIQQLISDYEDSEFVPEQLDEKSPFGGKRKREPQEDDHEPKKRKITPSNENPTEIDPTTNRINETRMRLNAIL